MESDDLIDIIRPLINKAMKIKKLVLPDGREPTFDDVEKSEPDLATEFAAVRVAYDKYYEFPLFFIPKEGQNIAKLPLVMTMLVINGVLRQIYRLISDEKVLPMRWGELKEIPDVLPDGTNSDDCEIMIIFQRTDAPVHSLPPAASSSSGQE